MRLTHNIFYHRGKYFFLYGVLAAGFLLIAPAVSWAQQGSNVIEDIVIQGAERTDGLSLLANLPVSIGDNFSQELMDETLKSLYATGNFDNVSVKREGNNLVVTISEQPIINTIAFEGNKVISDEILESEVRTRSRQTYRRTRVQRDVRNMLNLYQRHGRFAIRIEPKIIRLEQNRVNLVFEITEGRQTRIEHIIFIGNQFFDDGRLQQEILSRERRFLRFFGTNFDPERIEGDRLTLRRFYQNQGFPDIDISSAIAELSRAQDFFLLSFTVNEGNRYKIGKVTLQSTIEDLDLQHPVLQKLLQKTPVRTNKWYHADNIDNLQTNLIRAVNDIGVPFVDIAITEQRRSEDRAIDLVLTIERAPKIYIERIEIAGNTRTLDTVIRQQLLFTEGDPFIRSQINRAERDIRFTGFFKSVQMHILEGVKPNGVVLQIHVEEQLTGSLSFGLAHGNLNGSSIKFGLKERNFGGRGNAIAATLELSSSIKKFDISNTIPDYRGLPLSVNYRVFRSESGSSTTSYDKITQGGSTGISYRIGNSFWRHFISYNNSETTIENVTTNAVTIQQQIGSYTTSSIQQTFSRDTRNNRFQASRGTRFSLTQEYAGIGGNNHYVSTSVNYGIYHSLTRKIIVDFRIRAGNINETKDQLRIIDGFYIGGNFLRGFRYGRVGPYDETNNIHLPVTDYATFTFESFFPIGFPPESNVKGTVFIDSGIATNTDYQYDENVEISDTGSLRQAWGYGIVWTSPIGPIRFEWYKTLKKEETDLTEDNEFSLGVAF